MTVVTTPLSVLVPVRDEERNLEACLSALSWAEDLIVLDSGSEDATVKIARSTGARIFHREFDNFAAHKNWALDRVDFRHPWVLLVDADERVTRELAEEIRLLLAAGPDRNGYYIARKNYFKGRWMRHGGWWPDWQLRLIRRGKARYEQRLVHEHMHLEGPAGFLKNPLVHHDFKGIERYIDRHNVYSSLEAVEAYRCLRGGGAGADLLPEVDCGPALRRRLKIWAYRYVPCRPLFKFIWMYVIRLGFLDGRTGLRFSVLHAIYEFHVSLKLDELDEAGSPLREKYAKYVGKGS